MGRYIEDKLFKLRSKEKENTINGRMNIITYEWGKAVQNIYYALRFPKDKNIHMKDAKNELSHVVIQLNMLCQELGFDFDEVRLLGLTRLEERYVDFEINEWEKVDK